MVLSCLDDLKGQCVQISNHLEHKDHVPKSAIFTWKKLQKDFKNEIKSIEASLGGSIVYNGIRLSFSRVRHPQ